MVESRVQSELPIGVKDFKTIREKKLYFVDKSELISDILRNTTGVYLFTRPRRFGKSLNLSMLDAFFNLKYKGNNWFDGLKINDHPGVEKDRNVYPVVSLSMKELDYHNYDQFLSDFNELIRELYDQYNYLADSDKLTELQRTSYQNVLSGTSNISIMKKSLSILCAMLEQYHGVKPIVLLDEYDDTLNHTYGNDAYQDILSILRSFYTISFKDNEHITFAVLTGVMQIAKEGIFSGLNNFKVNNIFSVKFDERYGFTEPEVKELCSYYGHPEKFDEAKEWYDGYRFGNADIYNPWSILNYIDNEFVPGKYWAGTSGNDIIDTLIRHSDKRTLEDLTALGNGEAVTKSLLSSVAMGDLETIPNAIFSVLAVSGYLNAVPSGREYLLSIPNQEMYSVFYEHIRRFIFPAEKDYYSEFLDAAERGDVEQIQNSLYDLFSKNIPFILLDAEKNYQLVLAGLILSREGRYRISVEHESGNGRHDLILEHRYGKDPNIVIELNKAKTGSDTETKRLAHEALEQIKQKDYCKGLKGTTNLYGISFTGKKCVAILEKTVL